MKWENLEKYVKLKTGKLDANKADIDGKYPFFTCAIKPLRINNYAFDCECILIAGNGDLNVKYYNGKFNAYQRTYIAESKNKELLHPKYLHKFMDMSLERLRKKTRGGIIKYLRLNDLTSLKIKLPPLQDQIRIAEILSKAENLIAKRKESIRLLDELLKSTFLDMFGDPVKNEKGFSTISGSSLFKLSSGKFKPTKLLDNSYSYPTYGGNGRTGFSDDFLIDYKTIVIGRVGAYCGCVHISEQKSWITDNAIYIKKFYDEINLLFLYHQLIHINLRKFAQTAGQPKITQKPIEKFQFQLPSLSLQNKFAEIVNKVEAIKAKYKANLTELENLYGSLSQRAFKGELDLN
ncbi:MAG: restriction endonuclease subunit S [Candidatus Tenebribacter mawsonii]|nr:restriction endonuclease subunit S [Candidatus Tenebribacter mawsonii]